MSKYLFQASYTIEGAKGIQSSGGSSRRDVLAKVAENMGGRLEALYFGFGKTDVYVIMDLPGNEAAAAVAIAVNSTGAASVETVVLLTPEEIDAAAKGSSVGYRPPGS